MRPTTLELLEELDHVLETQIVPLLPDEHVKARMNVASQIIRAVHNRVRLQGEVLAADNADLVALLARLAGQSDPGGEPAYVSVDSLAERNDVLKAALVAAIDGLDALPEAERSRGDDAINAYLRRQLDRELELTALPVFGDAPADLPLV
ncbi:hypothetical protein [Nocardioides soli]|uniref:Uncharacterized protein n=1 Tax=Nocardioides soli TaxID=1036020 RepID=A0A7W4VWV8_9ACTN|nr:hypothetical protein [Nocardioides soli]MBB3042854.1 hypothetical protein [Nocardioides soli]